MARPPPAGGRFVLTPSKQPNQKQARTAISNSSKQSGTDQDPSNKTRGGTEARRNTRSKTPVRPSGPLVTPEEAANARLSIEWVDKDGHHQPRSFATVESSKTKKAEDSKAKDEKGDDQEEEVSFEEDDEGGAADELGGLTEESGDEDPTDSDFEPGRRRQKKKTFRKAGGQSRRGR